MYFQAEGGGRGGEGETVQERVRCTFRGKVLEVGGGRGIVKCTLRQREVEGVERERQCNRG